MAAERARLHRLLALLLCCAPSAAASPGRAEQQVAATPEILTPVAALPAHIAGTFQDLTSCQQAENGDYFIFDRRAHAVYVAPAGLDSARKLIEIGSEVGRVLDPTTFDLAADRTFIVADGPGGNPRVQIFLASGSTLRGFRLPGRAVPRITLGNLVLNGVAAAEYTGSSIFISQPENGALITEFGIDGAPRRSFGDLRRTGHEAEGSVHVAMNAGIVAAIPGGGLYFVFLAGVPQFRRYDANGRLMFDRHIEGPDLDRFVQSLPTTWKRYKTEDGEIPLVMPSVLSAAVDRHGHLWISTAVGVTYVYDTAGDKRRTVRFRAAGLVSPTAMSFTPRGRLLIAPGCFAFAPGP